MSQSRNDIVDELIARCLTGEASVEEEKQLQAWRSETPENERRYLDLRKVFEVSQLHYQQRKSSPIELDIDREWEQILNQIRKTKEKPIIHLFQDRPSRSWIRIAAALLLLVASGLVINYFVSRNSEMHFETSENTLTLSLP